MEKITGKKVVLKEANYIVPQGDDDYIDPLEDDESDLFNDNAYDFGDFNLFRMFIKSLVKSFGLKEIQRSGNEGKDLYLSALTNGKLKFEFHVSVNDGEISLSVNGKEIISNLNYLQSDNADSVIETKIKKILSM